MPLGCEAKLIRLSALKFPQLRGLLLEERDACTWPCSITQMDAATS